MDHVVRYRGRNIINLRPITTLTVLGKRTPSSLYGRYVLPLAPVGTCRREIYMSCKGTTLIKSQNHLKPKDSVGTEWTFRSGQGTDSHTVDIDDDHFEVTCERIGKTEASTEGEDDEDEEIF